VLKRAARLRGCWNNSIVVEKRSREKSAAPLISLIPVSHHAGQGKTTAQSCGTFRLHVGQIIWH
jgi:uncharacterized protein YwlG (UPF0340 family)